MSPVQIIPEDERDPDAVIRDAESEMEQAKARYEAARDRWLELRKAAGYTVETGPARRWK